MEEAERPLCGFVLGHLVLELAPLLGEGADALVNPFVAVYFDLSARFGARGDDAVDLVLQVMLLVYHFRNIIQCILTWRLSGRGLGC